MGASMGPGRRVDPDALADLKRRIDLLALIGRDVPLKREAATRGGEWSAPCPLCPDGGRDRLRVQPNAPDGGRWWCRKCCPDTRWLDVVDYLQRRDGLTFTSAVDALGGGSIIVCAAASSYRAAQSIEPVEIEPEPTPTWREKGEAFVSWAEEQLWAERPSAGRWRDWLHDRGLRDETLRAWRVGLNPADQRPGPAEWGHPAGTKFWIPAGVTLPWYAAGVLWQLKIRRPDELIARGEPKYRSVAGGHPVLYGADTLAGQRVAILTEGEFDALLLWQEVRELVGVVTLGNAQKGLGARALRLLLPVARLLVAYDADEAGQQGNDRLASLSARVRSLRVPAGNDITEFWRGGGRLRDWIRFALDREDSVPVIASVTSEVPAAPPVPNALVDGVLVLAGALDWPEVMSITGQAVGPGETDWRRVVESPRLEGTVRKLILGGLHGALQRSRAGVPDGIWWSEWEARDVDEELSDASPRG